MPPIARSIRREGTQKACILQRWCERWSNFIDVKDTAEVRDGDWVAIQPIPSRNSRDTEVCLLFQVK